MQLFHTTLCCIQKNDIQITDPRVYYQCTKVLRYKTGDQLVVQINTTRYSVVLNTYDKTSLYGTIIEVTSQPITSLSKESTHLIMAMTNKREKMELMCQKATELWVTKLSIWLASRSVIKTISEHKMDRLKLIITEAAEQSWGWIVPTIDVITSLEWLPKYSCIAYQWWVDLKMKDKTIQSLVIGPEGWFESFELEGFTQRDFSFVAFSDTILRTETAGIIGAWILKNE